jgi:photosystem II stability/assembly factor-like uncharacterized protein
MKTLYVFLISMLAITEINAQSWVEQVSGTYSQLTSVYFLDSEIGYVVGSEGTVLKTINGGSNWIPQYSGTTKSLESVFFVNVNDGFIVGELGTFLKTTDGGTTWDKLNADSTIDLYSVFFTDQFNGFVAGYSSMLLTTNNGGATWNSTFPGTGYNFYSIFFANQSVGYLLGFRTLSPHYILFKTIDGGSTWSIASYCTGLSSMYFINSEKGFATSESNIENTTDGGLSWQSVYYIYASLMSINFQDENIGYSVGGNGMIVKSSNGGRTWGTQNSGTNLTLQSVFFPEQDTGYVVGDGGTILKTVNGGGIVGMNESFKDKTLLTLSPNPVQDMLTVNIPYLLLPGQITIFNSYGQVMINTKVFDNRTIFNMQNIPNGVYYVKYQNKNDIEIKILIKI